MPAGGSGVTRARARGTRVRSCVCAGAPCAPSPQHPCDAWWCACAFSCVPSTQEAALEIGRALEQVQRGVLACAVRIGASAGLWVNVAPCRIERQC